MTTSEIAVGVIVAVLGGYFGVLIVNASSRARLLRNFYISVGGAMFVGGLVAVAALFSTTATIALVIDGSISGIGLGIMLSHLVKH
jgi:hypothetical protein